MVQPAQVHFAPTRTLALLKKVFFRGESAAPPFECSHSSTAQVHFTVHTMCIYEFPNVTLSQDLIFLTLNGELLPYISQLVVYEISVALKRTNTKYLPKRSKKKKKKTLIRTELCDQIFH